MCLLACSTRKEGTSTPCNLVCYLAETIDPVNHPPVSPPAFHMFPSVFPSSPLLSVLLPSEPNKHYFFHGYDVQILFSAQLDVNVAGSLRRLRTLNSPLEDDDELVVRLATPLQEKIDVSDDVAVVQRLEELNLFGMSGGVFGVRRHAITQRREKTSTGYGGGDACAGHSVVACLRALVREIRH